MTFNPVNLTNLIATAGNARLELVALAIANEAIRNAPVDTGELKQSIRARKIDDKTWRVTAHAPHALHVEFGTLRRPATPFLRPALDTVKASL